MAISTRELAEWLGGRVDGDPSVQLDRAARIEDAEPGTVSFVANPKYAALAAHTRASALVVAEAFDGPVAAGCTLLRVSDPYASFGKVLERLAASTNSSRQGIAEQAVIDPSASVHPQAYVGPYAVIEADAVIEAGAQVHALVSVGKGVHVGEKSVLFPGVVVYPGCLIGRHCILHAGAVLGSDGFGFAPQADGSFRKIPQLGNVVLEDAVEIGANTTIDRATLGSTTVRQGAKIDNLVQLAHNADIGAHSVLAAQSGVSGSTKLGMGVQVGGQAGLVGHLQIADGTRINAQSGVNRSVDRPGTALTGSPAGEYRKELKNQVIYRRLPDMEARLRALESRLAAWEAKAASTQEHRPPKTPDHGID